MGLTYFSYIELLNGKYHLSKSLIPIITQLTNDGQVIYVLGAEKHLKYSILRNIKLAKIKQKL